MKPPLPSNWREDLLKYLEERKRKGLVPAYVTEEQDSRKKKEDKGAQ